MNLRIQQAKPRDANETPASTTNDSANIQYPPTSEGTAMPNAATRLTIAASSTEAINPSLTLFFQPNHAPSAARTAMTIAAIIRARYSSDDCCQLNFNAGAAPKSARMPHTASAIPPQT